MRRLELLGLTFSLGDRKLVVARARTARPAHVTLSWNNASGEIDLHLKLGPNERGGDTVYEPLLRIPQQHVVAEAERAGELVRRMMERLVREFRPVTPEWLRFRRYVIVLPEEGSFVAALRAAVPKSGGKYRWRGFKNSERERALRAATMRFYRPGVLRQLTGPEVNWPVMAIPVERHGMHQGMLSIGRREAPDGSVGWMMFRPKHVTRAFRAVVDAIVRRIAGYVGPEHAMAWERIVEALDLNGIVQARQLVHRLRLFFCNPQVAL